MLIELATQYLSYVDEMFTTESKISLLTNNDFSWDGAATVKVYRITTAGMHDYGRRGPEVGNWSRYGPLQSLDATTQSMTLRRDRSFSFVIDRLDADETKRALQASTALARQVREVVLPEVDAWTYAQMSEHAGIKPAAAALTPDNIFDEIVKGSNALDNAEVPEVGRCLMVTPDTYMMMKKNNSIIMETNIAQDMRLRGIIAMIDGLNVIRIPANRLPDSFGFMIAHPVATVAPTKLASYRIHENPPGINGSLVEGRINYDAFVLENKADALYLQATV